MRSKIPAASTASNRSSGRRPRARAKSWRVGASSVGAQRCIERAADAGDQQAAGARLAQQVAGCRRQKRTRQCMALGRRFEPRTAAKPGLGASRGEHLEAGGVGAALEVVPDVGQRVLVVGIGLGERVPGLLVQGRVVQALGPPLDIFEVARVPVPVQLAPQAGLLGRLAGQRPLGAVGRGGGTVPPGQHLLAVDQHHRGVAGIDGEIAVAVQRQVEQKCRDRRGRSGRRRCRSPCPCRPAKSGMAKR